MILFLCTCTFAYLYICICEYLHLCIFVYSHRSFEEHHIDEGDEKIWRAMFAERALEVRPVHHPLQEDHEDEVAEDEEEEDDLGEELKDDGVVLPVVEFVPHAQQDSKGHVDHPKDKGDLHLVSIQKRYRV